MSINRPISGFSYHQKDVVLKAEVYTHVLQKTCRGYECRNGGNIFKWSSDIDGFLSDKPLAVCQFLTPSKHKIALEVINENGTKATKVVEIEILPSENTPESK